LGGRFCVKENGMSISITPRAWCLAAILAALAPLPALAEQAQDANPLAPGAAAASSVQPNFQGTYDRLDASQEAYERGEAERREAIRRQTQTVEDMVWYSGVPGYAPAPLGLGYVYGMGGWRPIPRAWRVETPYPFPEPVPPAYGYPYPAYPYAFAPWPLVPGDIYGYPYVNRVQ